MISPRRALVRKRAVGKPPSRMFMLSLGLATIGFAVLMFWIGFNAPNNIPSSSYYNLNVRFANADNLAPHAEVRLGGRLIGQALNLQVVNGTAEARLQLTTAVQPLRADTTVQVLPRSPIGVKYLNIVPGTHGGPLPNGATIDASHTTYPVELDQVLDSLDPKTRARTEQLLTQLGEGFAGRGQDLNTTIGLTPSLLNDTGAVAGAINARTGAMSGFIRSTEAAAAAVDPVRQVMTSGYQPEADALAPFYEQGPALQQLLSEAPGELPAITNGLARTQPMLSALERLAVDSRPALTAAPVALAHTTAFLRTARPSMAELDSTVKLGGRAVNPTLAFLHTIQPVLPSANRAMNESVPILTNLAPRGCDIDTMFGNWASMLGYGDAGGNYLRFDLVAPSLQSLDELPTNTTGLRSDPYPAPCVAAHQ